jgi:hypothetical protein
MDAIGPVVSGKIKKQTTTLFDTFRLLVSFV